MNARHSPLSPTPDAINARILVLATLSVLLQAVALLGVLPIAAQSAGRHVFSTVEMLLVVGLLTQSWQIRQWSRQTGQTEEVQATAKLCFYSLLFCGLGDLVNRNYLEQYYLWDDVIKHSYLVNSILFFFPGYLLVLVATQRLTRSHVTAKEAGIGTAVALIVGTLAFVNDYKAEVHPLSSAAIWIYTLLHVVMAFSTLGLIKTYGWPASALVVIGILLAPIADVFIGNFWVYRDYFPTIEHVNWILYFSSLAMIQQLSFLAAKRPKHSRAD